jgi:multidrug efflux pump subunit AcrB
VPIRLQLPAESQVGLDAILAMPLRAANGQLVPLSELVTVERGIIDKPLFTKDLQGVSYVFGDMAGQTGLTAVWFVCHSRNHGKVCARNR